MHDVDREGVMRDEENIVLACRKGDMIFGRRRSFIDLCDNTNHEMDLKCKKKEDKKLLLAGVKPPTFCRFTLESVDLALDDSVCAAVQFLDMEGSWPVLCGVNRNAACLSLVWLGLAWLGLAWLGLVCCVVFASLRFTVLWLG